MSPTPLLLTCASCRAILSEGEALLVTPNDGAPAFLVHRPEAHGYCFRAAGRGDETTISLLDAAEARAHDREAGAAMNGSRGTPPPGVLPARPFAATRLHPRQPLRTHTRDLTT